MNSQSLLDANGKPVILGQEIAKGGEGAVHHVVGQPHSVAKLYLRPPAKQQAEKLAAMATLAQERLLKIAAWPTGTLYDPSGQLVGFTMPKIDGSRAAFELYSPKLRLRQFPKADWRFLIHAAANAARAFSVVHSAGHVIGDVNERNLAVGQDATVHLFDCDSFQITDGRRSWLCEVGVDTHQPPEIQQLSSFRGVVRTANHDNFGLAVLIFQMLCIARHPFSGVVHGSGEAPSISEAIKAFRYAYSRNPSVGRLYPPPGSLPIEAVGSSIQNLFEQAFSSAAVSGGGRPTAEQWVSALGSLSRNLKQCHGNAGHHYLSGLISCPWCEIEAKSRITLFPVVFIEGAQTVGIAALWQQVNSLADPGPMPPFPILGKGQAKPSNDATRIGKQWRRRKGAALVFGTIGVIIAFALPLGLASLGLALLIAAAALALYHRPPRGREVERIWSTLAPARRGLAELRKLWETPEHRPTFAEVRQSLETLKRTLDDLPNERAQRLQKLHEDLRLTQLVDYLDRFQIRDAKIPNIGKARLATLQSHGIETAADISPSKLQSIPGFGTSIIYNLNAWRQQCEQSFRFDPSRGVAPADIAAIERDIAMRRHKLEQEIATGVNRLKAIAHHTMAHRRALEARLAELRSAYEQAIADAVAARLVTE